MAAEHGLADIIYLARVPIVVAMIWAILGIASESFVPSSAAADVVHFIVRVGIVATAGYVVTRSKEFGLLGGAVSGAVVMFADHVLVKGAFFLITDELTAAGGVLVSYVMFFWVAMFIAFLGALAGRFKARHEAAI